MTPAELRRLADQRMTAAAALAADAGRLRAQAAGLEGILDPLVPMSQQVWTGPAASAFEDQVRAHAGVVNEQVHRLRQVAVDLDRRADDARRDAALLRARATAAEIAASAAAGVL